MIGYGSLATGMALQRNKRQQIVAERIMSHMLEEQTFMARYRNRPDVRFQRRFGGLVAIVNGQPHIPRVKRSLDQHKPKG